jgi:hypothetical protein
VTSIVSSSPTFPLSLELSGGGGLIDTGAMSTEEDEVEQDIETEASSRPEESTSGVTDEEDDEEDDDDKGKGKGKDDVGPNPTEPPILECTSPSTNPILGPSFDDTFINFH